MPGAHVMIDLHTHTLFSDGELVPAELVVRALSLGYRAVALTDHGDYSNIDFIIPRIVHACRRLKAFSELKVMAGVELTHVHPRDISELTEEARSLGAQLVVVHGETIVEPVTPGTNRAAIEAGVDILAHPGLITEDDAAAAAENNIYLEISARSGHSLTNGHVAAIARRCGAKLVLNTDAHAPGDLLTRDRARRVALGAGMRDDEIDEMFRNSESLCRVAVER